MQLWLTKYRASFSPTPGPGVIQNSMKDVFWGHPLVRAQNVLAMNLFAPDMPSKWDLWGEGDALGIGSSPGDEEPTVQEAFPFGEIEGLCRYFVLLE